MWVDVDTAITVPVNLLALTDDTDFKSREIGIVYNQAGMDLVWNFQTTAGVTSQTAVTPTTAGDYDWTHSGDAMYKIEIPASGGASINNDAEGAGWFTGICTGVLAWRGPEIHFRAAALNNALIDGGDELDVNVTKVADTAQTGNDNGADINTLLTRLIGTIAAGTHNAQSGDAYSRIGATGSGLTSLAQALVCTETRLAELDAANIPADLTTITAYVDELESRLTAVRAAYLDVAISSRNSVVPDAAGTAPTAIEIRQEIDTNSTKSGYALSATGLDLILFNSIFLLASAKANWTDDLTAYTDGMAGKRVKGITAVPTEEGTINDASATTTTFITTFTGFEDDHFKDALCIVEIAASQWQGRPILSSNGTTGQIVLDEGLTSAPANGVNIAIQAQHIHPVSQIRDGILADSTPFNGADIATIVSQIGTAGAGLTDLGGMSTGMKAEVLAEVIKVLVTQMTESYAVDGTAPTMTQSLMLIQQALTEFAISGTTKTIKKLDGSTTAATETLDDDTNPTSITRAT